MTVFRTGVLGDSTMAELSAENSPARISNLCTPTSAPINKEKPPKDGN